MLKKYGSYRLEHSKSFFRLSVLLVIGHYYFLDGKSVTHLRTTHYDQVKQVLDRYQRSITFLELAPRDGYFASRIAGEYDSTCVLLCDTERSKRSMNAWCMANDEKHNMLVLGKHMSNDDLLRLGDCEAFDVVYIHSPMVQLDHAWKKRLDMLVRLGDHVFIELPSVAKYRKEIESYLKKRNGELKSITREKKSAVGHVRLYWITHEKTKLLRRTFFDITDLHSYGIVSNFFKKTLIKNVSNQRVGWCKGINLITFKLLGGCYPQKDVLKKALVNIQDFAARDWLPHNMVLQGDRLVKIDCSNPLLQNQGRCRDELVQAVSAWLELDEPNAIKKRFFELADTEFPSVQYS